MQRWSMRASNGQATPAAVRQKKGRRREPARTIRLLRRGADRGWHRADRHRSEIAAQRRGLNRRKLCRRRGRRAVADQQPCPRVQPRQPTQPPSAAPEEIVAQGPRDCQAAGRSDPPGADHRPDVDLLQRQRSGEGRAGGRTRKEDARQARHRERARLEARAGPATEEAWLTAGVCRSLPAAGRKGLAFANRFAAVRARQIELRWRDEMVRMMVLLAATTALAGCAARTLPPAEIAPPAETAMVPEAAPAPKPEIGTFGFDTAGMDTSVRPGANFYLYANGTWRRNTPIPPEKSNYSMFTKLDDLSKERTKLIVEEAAKDPANKIGNAYSSYLDEATVEAKGLGPLEPWLGEIRSLSSKSGYPALLARAERLGIGTPFAAFIGQD